tara:strand:- start:289 stop:483 length:195 start_codon:yes stop_codon:yes gene_type:complete
MRFGKKHGNAETYAMKAQARKEDLEKATKDPKRHGNPFGKKEKKSEDEKGKKENGEDNKEGTKK